MRLSRFHAFCNFTGPRFLYYARKGRRRIQCGARFPFARLVTGNDPPPALVEVDFVAHSGTSSAGSFVQTVMLTVIAPLRRGFS
jgi:hypothetical protein